MLSEIVRNKGQPVQTVNSVTPVLPRLTPTLRSPESLNTLPQPLGDTKCPPL